MIEGGSIEVWKKAVHHRHGRRQVDSPQGPLVDAGLPYIDLDKVEWATYSLPGRGGEELVDTFGADIMDGDR